MLDLKAFLLPPGLFSGSALLCFLQFFNYNDLFIFFSIFNVFVFFFVSVSLFLFLNVGYFLPVCADFDCKEWITWSSKGQRIRMKKICLSPGTLTDEENPLKKDGLQSLHSVQRLPGSLGL